MPGCPGLKKFLPISGAAENTLLARTSMIFGADVHVRSEKNSLNIKFLGGIFLGHPGPRRREIPDKNFMQVAFLCCFRQGVAGMFRGLGRDVPDLEKLYVRKLWADFSHPTMTEGFLKNFVPKTFALVIWPLMEQMLAQGQNLGFLDEAGSRCTSRLRTRKPRQSAQAESDSTQGVFP